MTVIREMQFDDLDQVLAIEEKNFSVPWTANGFFSFLLREDARFWVAEADGKIAGYCGLILTPPEGDITNVCVDQPFRRRGVAVKLLDTLIREAASLGVTQIHLEVRMSNTPAVALYEQLGFVRDGLRPRYYENPTEDALLMTLHSDTSAL